VLLVIAAAATGIGVVATSAGPRNFACLTIAQNGNTLHVTTSGLIHYLKGQYYITCTEGSSLPTTPLTISCLTITPKLQLSSLGIGASTYYYYLSAPGHEMTVQGAPNPVDGAEIVTPANASISATC
jgi:hypothetical protein